MSGCQRSRGVGFSTVLCALLSSSGQTTEAVQEDRTLVPAPVLPVRLVPNSGFRADLARDHHSRSGVGDLQTAPCPGWLCRGAVTSDSNRPHGEGANWRCASDTRQSWQCADACAQYLKHRVCALRAPCPLLSPCCHSPQGAFQNHPLLTQCPDPRTCSLNTASSPAKPLVPTQSIGN